jgi:Protein of unknown function (DUF1549)
MNIQLKDARLEKQWGILVRPPMKAAAPLVAGVGGLPGATRAFSAVQAAWRFYRNERVELSELVVPLRDHVREQLADESDAAFSNVIDRLLASLRYGERWGRRWLDVVRYADTAGDNSDSTIPQMHRYRDWVNDAFNRDLPYAERSGTRCWIWGASA